MFRLVLIYPSIYLTRHVDRKVMVGYSNTKVSECSRCNAQVLQLTLRCCSCNTESQELQLKSIYSYPSIYPTDWNFVTNHITQQMKCSTAGACVPNQVLFQFCCGDTQSRHRRHRTYRLCRLCCSGLAFISAKQSVLKSIWSFRARVSYLMLLNCACNLFSSGSTFCSSWWTASHASGAARRCCSGLSRPSFQHWRSF